MKESGVHGQGCFHDDRDRDAAAADVGPEGEAGFEVPGAILPPRMLLSVACSADVSTPPLWTFRGRAWRGTGMTRQSVALCLLAGMEAGHPDGPLAVSRPPGLVQYQARCVPAAPGDCRWDSKPPGTVFRPQERDRPFPL